MRNRRGSAIGQWIIAFTGLIGAAIAVMPLITGMYGGKVKMVTDKYAEAGNGITIGGSFANAGAPLAMTVSTHYQNHMVESTGKNYQESTDEKAINANKEMTVKSKSFQVRLPGAKQITTGVKGRAAQLGLWEKTP